MVKDHSDSERGNPLPPHGLLFPISSKGSFICTIPQTGEHIPRPLLHQSWSTGWNEKTERGDPLPPLHGQRFPINSKVFYMHHHTNRQHTTAFDKPVVEHCQ